LDTAAPLDTLRFGHALRAIETLRFRLKIKLTFNPMMKIVGFLLVFLDGFE
jgi:hypothetical protein